MEVDNFGQFIKYIRNFIISQPDENAEGDDLSLIIFDNEITIRVNEFYDDGFEITYNPKRKFFKCRFLKKNIEERDINEIRKISLLSEFIEDNKNVIDNFLERKN